MGTIKDSNGMNLKEPEDIKRRWQDRRNVKKKKILTQITMMV